jgi:hypothetical protein
VAGREAGDGGDGRAPGRPISWHEHQASKMLLACQGQLRLAPSGHVIGIEMYAALKIGAARDYDLAVVSKEVVQASGWGEGVDAGVGAVVVVVVQPGVDGVSALA